LPACLRLIEDMSPTLAFPANAARILSLVHCASAGDRAAFGELYTRYVRMVHGILLARVPAPDAEDLVQEVFLAAMDRLPALRDGGAFGGWLASIARSKAADYMRSRKWMVEVPATLAAAGPSAESRLEALRILAYIQELPEAYRETLVLRLVEGLTGPEIAEQTGLTAGSVRVNLTRGMKLLRERINVGKAP
jgi:RNA polymerase sigma-70 factor, ECF subfamily